MIGKYIAVLTSDPALTKDHENLLWYIAFENPFLVLPI